MKDTAAYVNDVWHYAASNRCSQWLAFECLCKDGDIPEAAQVEVHSALWAEQIAARHRF
jgi:hypothetical protein